MSHHMACVMLVYLIFIITTPYNITHFCTMLLLGDENGYESSIDNDDDISSEDEVEASRQQTEASQMSGISC